jgi:hypothetical protein
VIQICFRKNAQQERGKKMKKITFASSILAAMSIATVVLPTVASAADPIEQDTTGKVTFVKDTTPENPKDPDKPGTDIEEPGDGEGPKGNGDGLSIDYAPNLNFGTHKVTTSAITAYAYGVGSKKDGSFARSNYVQVSDKRGTQAGWKLTLKQGAQFKTATDDVLTAAAITLKSPRLVYGTEDTIPTYKPSTVLTSDTELTPGTSVTVMTAAAKEGMGTWLTAWGAKDNTDDVSPYKDDAGTLKTDAAATSGNVTLSIPKNTPILAQEYTTTLTWTLADTPA